MSTVQESLIVAAAIIDGLCVVALVVAGLAFRASTRRGVQMARPLIDRGRRMAATGQRLAGTTRTRSEAIRHVVQALAADVSARVTTVRRIVGEVIHPDTSTLQGVARTVEEGRAWADRLGRLRAAAHRAAGVDGHGSP